MRGVFDEAVLSRPASTCLIVAHRDHGVLGPLGHVYQGRRDEQSSRGSHYLKLRPLSTYLELFRQRQRKQHPIVKRSSPLS